MKELPFRLIGAFTFRLKNTSDLGKGTATLISPDLILTAAHNLYSVETGKVSFDCSFYPGQHGELTVGNEYKIESSSSFNKFVKSNSVTDDYAILKLQSQVEDVKEFMPLSVDIRDVNRKELIISGYPKRGNYKRIDLGKTTVNQFGLSETGKVDKVFKTRPEIRYRISTFPGQSGAPIVLKDSGRFRIVGIHKGAIPNKKDLNAGRVITAELVSTLKSEAKRMGARMFLVDSDI